MIAYKHIHGKDSHHPTLSTSGAFQQIQLSRWHRTLNTHYHYHDHEHPPVQVTQDLEGLILLQSSSLSWIGLMFSFWKGFHPKWHRHLFLHSFVRTFELILTKILVDLGNNLLKIGKFFKNSQISVELWKCKSLSADGAPLEVNKKPIDSLLPSLGQEKTFSLTMSWSTLFCFSKPTVFPLGATEPLSSVGGPLQVA